MAAGRDGGGREADAVRRAAAFKPSARYEELLSLRAADPARFAALPPATRAAAEAYAEAKAAKARLEEEAGDERP